MVKRVELFLKSHFSNFKIVRKQDSKLMRILGKILFFNKAFMTNYTTTIGHTVYTPSSWESLNEIVQSTILFHESIHIFDNDRYGFLFPLSYLFPQCLSILALLSFFNVWFLLFLLFLLPIPAPFRKDWEVRGYSMSILAYSTFTGWGIPDTKKMADNFTNGNYYWMWPFKDEIFMKFGDVLKLVMTDKIPFSDKETQKYAVEVKKFIRKSLKDV